MGNAHMKIIKIMITLTGLSFLTACSSIISGTSQVLSINSSPAEASCTLMRNGLPIGQVKTPGGATVTRTKHNIEVTCKKDGYEDGRAYIKSEVAGATFGNILLGGGIGWAIDSSSGADNSYAEVTTVALTPKLATNNISPISGTLSLSSAEEKCSELGFAKGTEKYASCVIQLSK